MSFLETKPDAFCMHMKVYTHNLHNKKDDSYAVGCYKSYNTTAPKDFSDFGCCEDI